MCVPAVRRYLLQRRCGQALARTWGEDHVGEILPAVHRDNPFVAAPAAADIDDEPLPPDEPLELDEALHREATRRKEIRRDNHLVRAALEPLRGIVNRDAAADLQAPGPCP